MCVRVCVELANARKFASTRAQKKAAKLCVARTRHKEHSTTNRQRSSGADVCRRWRVGIDFLISCPHPPFLYLLTHQKKTTKDSSPPALLPPNDGGGCFCLALTHSLTQHTHTHTHTLTHRDEQREINGKIHHRVRDGRPLSLPSPTSFPLPPTTSNSSQRGGGLEIKYKKAP